MTNSNQAGPAFLAELAENVVMSASIVQDVVKGPEAVRDVILATGSLYASKTAGVAGAIGNKTVVQYDATLPSGESLNAIVVLTRGSNNLVEEINIGYSPMSSVHVLAERLEAALKK
jgi:hypothetical protein